MSNVKAITDAEFPSMEAGKPYIVDFWAEWCGPCKAIGPVLDKLSEEFPDVEVRKMNVDENTDVPMQHGIRGIPTLIMFKDGEAVERVVGANPAAIRELFVKAKEQA